MKSIVIHSSDTVAALNQLVAGHLPHLRFILFDQNGLPVEGSRVNMLLETLIQKPKTPVIQIDLDLTVAELENLWKQQWGLRIEVYRRNGFTWSDTDTTRHWTLREQNKKGEEILRNF